MLNISCCVKALIIIVLLSNSGAIYSQTNVSNTLLIEGIVTDKSKIPIENALVYLSSDDDVLGYTYTSESGKFYLKIPAISKNILITVKSLEYSEKKFVLDSEDIKNPLILELDRGIFTLQEVIVRGRSERAAYNDTTSINIEKIVDPQDRNLENTLKKIPGFLVNQDGIISYKGVNISKIFIDGDDLTATNYQRISKNLNPRFIESIDIIERFIENELLGDMVYSNETVINLNFPESSRSIIFGDVNLFYGNNNFREVSGNLFFIKDDFKLLTSDKKAAHFYDS